MHWHQNKSIGSLGVLLLTGCLVSFRSAVPEPRQVSGITMGTTYSVTYYDEKHRDLKPSIDSVLSRVNKSISNFDAAATVTLFNQSRRGMAVSQDHFFVLIRKALEVAGASKGAYDPTILPLVNAWRGKPEVPDPFEIDSLKSVVGYNKIELRTDSLKKSDFRVRLDFGGIGQGYGVDVVSRFLLSKGISNFIVEIGGEGYAAGKNLGKDADWVVGIMDPKSERGSPSFKAYVSIRDRSFTTSGNYLNYREVDGVRYGHIIDPTTGYPVQHRLLSVSLFSSDCTTADAWATALMVMGSEEAIGTLALHPELDALLIYSLPDGETGTFVTPGIKSRISFEQ